MVKPETRDGVLFKGGITNMDNYRIIEGKKKNVSGALGKSFPTIHPYDNYEPKEGTASVSGTSIFDPVLCEIVYRWFCPDGGSIIDPFAGGSVRGIVAGYLGHPYTGLDLRANQIEANNIQADDIKPKVKPTWIVGNSENISDLAKGQYDLVFSCPPYYDLEVYSDNP